MSNNSGRVQWSIFNRSALLCFEKYTIPKCHYQIRDPNWLKFNYLNYRCALNGVTFSVNVDKKKKNEFKKLHSDAWPQQFWTQKPERHKYMCSRRLFIESNHWNIPFWAPWCSIRVPLHAVFNVNQLNPIFLFKTPQEVQVWAEHSSISGSILGWVQLSLWCLVQMWLTVL